MKIVKSGPNAVKIVTSGPNGANAARMAGENGRGDNRIALHVSAGRRRENRGNSVTPFANRGKRRRQYAAKPTGGVRLMQTSKDAGNFAKNAGGNGQFAKNASGNVLALHWQPPSVC